MTWALEKLFGLVTGLFPASWKFWLELIVSVVVLASCAYSGAFVMGKMKEGEVADAKLETQTITNAHNQFVDHVNEVGKQQEILNAQTEAKNAEINQTIIDEYHNQRTALIAALRVPVPASDKGSAGGGALPEVPTPASGVDAATSQLQTDCANSDWAAFDALTLWNLQRWVRAQQKGN